MLADILAKIRLSNSGYLPNYPYHLISDKELYDAFMDCKSGTGYFFDAYPFLNNSALSVPYKQLVLTIQYYLLLAQLSTAANAREDIPDWIYSYMLGFVIGVQSDKKDIHDLIYPLGVDNVDDDFNWQCSVACVNTSQEWIKRKHLSKLIRIPEKYEDEMISIQEQTIEVKLDLSGVDNGIIKVNGETFKKVVGDTEEFFKSLF